MIDAKADVTAETLLKAKVISHKRDGIRLVGGGTLKTKLALKVAGATKAAQDAVTKAGGSVDFIKIEIKPVVRKKAIPQ
jgi:large subunit ribosomal protein L15